MLRVELDHRFDIGEWAVAAHVDSDGHLNIYLENVESDVILQTDTGQGDGVNEQYALRFTTPQIEADAE